MVEKQEIISRLEDLINNIKENYQGEEFTLKLDWRKGWFDTSIGQTLKDKEK